MLIPNLTFDGNAEEIFNFYATAVQGRITAIHRYGDSAEGAQMPGTDKQKIMHIALEGSDGIKIIGNDYVNFDGQPFIAGNNISLSLNPDSDEKADELFNALSEGGLVIMPMGKVPWGAYFGMFIDKFGIKWMINHQY